MLQDNQKFHALDRRTAELLNAVTGSGLEFKKNEEVVDMCIAIEQMKQEAIQEATPEISKAAEVKTLLASIRSLIAKANFSEEQAMEALSIPETEREEYSKMLQN